MQSVSGVDYLNFYVMSTFSKVGAQCGFNMQDAVSQAQIAVEVTDSPQSQLSLAALLRLFDVCEAAAASAYFPLVLGDNFAFDAIPEVDTFLATCTTLRGAMLALGWMPLIVHPALRIQPQEHGADFFVSMALEGGEAPHQGILESCMASVVRFARLLTPQQDPLREVWFQHGPRTHPGVYGRYFGVPVRFHQADDRLVFALDCMDKPLKGGFPALNAQAQLMVEQRLRKIGEQGRLSTRLEHLWNTRPDLLGARIDEVAVLLELHPRTFQRRLKDEGESFVDVQARVRRERACKLLKDTDLDIEAISIKLGFVDRHSFTRAFTRWEGVSPIAFRNARRSS